MATCFATTTRWPVHIIQQYIALALVRVTSYINAHVEGGDISMDRIMDSVWKSLACCPA